MNTHITSERMKVEVVAVVVGKEQRRNGGKGGGRNGRGKTAGVSHLPRHHQDRTEEEEQEEKIRRNKINRGNYLSEKGKEEKSVGIGDERKGKIKVRKEKN